MATVDKEIVQVKYSMVAGQYGGQLFYPSDWMRAELAEKAMTIPSEADLFTETAGQYYPIETQLRKNGNLYRYSKAGETMAASTLGFLKGNRTIVPGSAGNSVHSGYEGAPYAAVVVGDTSIKITDTAALKNEYESAVIQIYNDTSHIYEQYLVIGNDASTGVYTTLYIAPPGFLTALATTGVTLNVYLSPYGTVGSLLTNNLNWKSALGMARFAITDNYYFWMQTAGVCFGTGASTWPGQTAYQREVYANTDGSLIGKTSTTYLYQRVGYLRQGTASDYGDVCFMMQLDQ